MSKQVKFFAAVGVVLSLVLAACGTQQKAQSNSGKLASSQVLRLSAAAPLDTIDISKATGYGQTGNIFESLYRLGKNGSVTPGLASSGKVSQDGKTWTFKIRDAKWSDGSKITAQDFVYSWQRTLTPKTKAQYAYLFSGIQNADKISQGKLKPSQLGVSAPDQHTFVVHLDKPISYFKVLMTYPLFGPISKAAVDRWGSKYATNSKYMLYSGPFKMTGWTGTNNRWEFVKNNQYWDKKAVRLSKISYSVNESTSTALNLYQSNKLDMTQLSNEQVKNYKHNADYQTEPYSYMTWLSYNFKASDKNVRKALNNRNIRKAISLSINRSQLISSVLGDASRLPAGFVVKDLAKNAKTGKDFAATEKVDNSVTYNSKLAKQLWQKGLKEVGLKKLTLSLLSDNQDVTKTQVQYYKGQLQKNLSGLTVDLKSIPSQVAYKRAGDGDFDLYLSGWGADFNDPISFLQTMQSTSGYNYGKWSNKQYDQLISQAQGKDSNDTQARWQDMTDAAKLTMQDQTVAPLYQTVYSFLVRPSVKGVIHNTAGTQWNYKYAYISK